MSRSKRRSYGRALGAVGAAAAMATTAVVPLSITAAAGATPDQRRPPPAPVIVEPALVAASDAVQDRRETELVLAVMTRAAAQKTDRDSIWDSIAACETQGNWSMRGSSFSGGLGFANSAWNAFGGQEFAPNAGQATREQQIVVAERIRASVGLGAWGCARKLGLTRR